MNILKKEDFYVDRNKTFIEESYDINSAIILNNIGRPRYTCIDGEKEFKTCRFCGKNETEVNFNNKSHVVPKFLGNFLVISNFECDECNAHFSRYETELEKFVKIPLIANRKDKDLKDRYGKNISRVGDDIIVNGEQEKVEFNGLFVLKILLKFAYSMIDEDQIDNYKNIRDILLSDKIPKITCILDITSRTPFDWNSIMLYDNKNKEEGKYVDNILTVNFNMKKYVIFFNKDNTKTEINDILIREEYIKFFNDLDIYNHRVRDFQNEHVQIKFNIDVFMQFIKHGIQ